MVVKRRSPARGVKEGGNRGRVERRSRRERRLSRGGVVVKRLKIIPYNLL